MPRIIFFDGPCRLCNGFVQTILKIDHAKTFQFSSLQSATARRLLSEQDLSLASVIYYDGQVTVSKSEAVIQILQQLDGFYTFLAALIRAIPQSVRDSIYDLVARNRYRIFGKDEVCQLPSPRTAERFLN